MSIRTVEVICAPCYKCSGLESKIREMIMMLEAPHGGTKIEYTYKHIKDLAELSKYSVNAAQTPVIIINGNVEVAGRFEPLALKRKLEKIIKIG